MLSLTLGVMNSENQNIDDAAPGPLTIFDKVRLGTGLLCWAMQPSVEAESVGGTPPYSLTLRPLRVNACVVGAYMRRARSASSAGKPAM